VEALGTEAIPFTITVALRSQSCYRHLDKLDMERHMEWQMADAKNRFSELMNRALQEGPQRVRRRNNAVIVLAEEDYERMAGNRPDFKEYLRRPVGLDELDLSRDQSPGRDVPL
jgi:antitoxin Phd